MTTQSLKSKQPKLTRSTSQFELRFLAMPLWFLLICSAVLAQQRIQGTVTGKDTQRPVAAASVKLESDLLPSGQVATTDADGHFSFASLSPGRYTVSAVAEQFYTEEVTMLLTPRATQHIDFELSPVAQVQEQVTVRAESKLLDETQAATLTTISSEQIRLLPAARRTQLTELITPFVASAVGGHDNLVHLRGNELSLNTFINGVSFFDNPHQLFTPGLSPDVIQSVNVITGGFPAEFGNRFGGILDIVTRSGFDANNHGSLTIGAGTYLRDNVALDYGGHTERFGYFVYAAGFESDRFLNTPERRVFHDFGRGARSFHSTRLSSRRKRPLQVCAHRRRNEFRIAKRDRRRVAWARFLWAQSRADRSALLGAHLFRIVGHFNISVRTPCQRAARAYL